MTALDSLIIHTDCEGRFEMTAWHCPPEKANR